MCSSMAEPESESYPRPQKLVSTDQNHENPSKFYNHFLYKIALAVVFFVILPLFPSQAPEFINQSVSTRSWELLQILLVGIAVSYGLFSRFNEKVEKDNNTTNNNNTKFDNAHSYVSRILEVSSVFDDEAEVSTGPDENKVQAWSSQYFRNEPLVVVAQEHTVLDEQRGNSSSSILGEKPLLLPVRSLKQRVPDQDSIESVNESSVNSGGSLSRSNSRSGSKRFSSKSSKAGAGELGNLDHRELEEKLKESVVLPSPIPWRSRSGRLEMKEEVQVDSKSSTTTMEEPAEFNCLDPRADLRSQSFRASRSNSASSSPKPSPSPSVSTPKKISPAPSLSLESQAKSVEELMGRKRSFQRASIPPPPPPPPVFYKSSSMRPGNDELRRSFTSEAKKWNRSNGETKHRLSQVDGISMGKSVRTTRAGEQGFVHGKMEQIPKEVEVEKVTRKTVGFDESSFWTENMSHESSIPKSSGFVDSSEDDEKEDLFNKVVMESDEESENEDEDDNIGGCFAPKDVGEIPKPSPRPYVSVSGSASDGGPDVDKKADEFIAKFREQIRLQRIDSIKKSSAQISRNLTRKI